MTMHPNGHWSTKWNTWRPTAGVTRPNCGPRCTTSSSSQSSVWNPTCTTPWWANSRKEIVVSRCKVSMCWLIPISNHGCLKSTYCLPWARPVRLTRKSSACLWLMCLHWSECHRLRKINHPGNRVRLWRYTNY